jgi:hypothetical protein
LAYVWFEPQSRRPAESNIEFSGRASVVIC